MAYVCWEPLAIVTWSWARGWDGRGPGPLRDDGVFLVGYPNLSPKDQQKGQSGKRSHKVLCQSPKVFRCCLQLGVPVALENLHTSRLWLASPSKHLLNHGSTNWAYTDFCMDGKPFRKCTRFLWAHVDLSSYLKHCSASQGLGSRTGNRHQQL